MPSLLIVADDLTGALDSAVAFAGGERRVIVVRRVGRIREALAKKPDVLAVNTASREGTEASAVAAIEELAAMLPVRDIPVILKKVDSRLKGHVRAETAALARLAGRNRIVVAPAIPDMARIQREGRLTGAGIDGDIDIVARFGPGVEAPDAESDTALDRIARTNGSETLWTGARGLAFALARNAFGNVAWALPDLPRPLLIAIGSRDPITRAQVAALDLPPEPAPDGRVPEGVEGELQVVAMSDGGSGRPPAKAGADFADGIAARLDRTRPMTLLASGGETAEAILDRLGVGCLEVLAEIAPGLPVSVASVPWGRMRIVTKSGGFGPPDLLRRILAGAGAQNREGGDR